MFIQDGYTNGYNDHHPSSSSSQRDVTYSDIKDSSATNREIAHQSPKRGGYDSRYIAISSRRESRDRDVTARRRRGVPSQVEDAALAFRLQRKEFMEAFKETDGQPRNSLTSAMANLRALASMAMASTTAINFRRRDRMI